MTLTPSLLLRISCMTGEHAFAQLRSVWQTLERVDEQCTPFNTWLWNSLWWEHYGKSCDELVLLVATVQSNRNSQISQVGSLQTRQDVVAIAPLYIHNTYMCKRIPVKVLRFVGTGRDTSPDYLNIIAHPTWRQQAEVAFMKNLPSIKQWQKLYLSDVREESTLAQRIEELVHTSGNTTLKKRIQTIQRASLPATFDEYRRRLTRKRRKQINHRQNRLDKAGKTELNICATLTEVSEATQALIELHRERWMSKGELGKFRSDEYVQFHSAVITQFFAQDALWLTTLRLNKKFVGVQYIFAWRGQLMFMQSGYSPEVESLSPGHVLFTYAIKRGIEQGMHTIDMLKGNYEYKSAYTQDSVAMIDQGCIRPGIRAIIDRLRTSLYA